MVEHPGVHPCASTLSGGARGAIGCPVLTSWVTRLLTWMGGGVGTEELFAGHARGLALNARLASLRLAEEGGHLVTKLVPKRSTSHASGQRTQEPWPQACAASSLLRLLCLPQEALVGVGALWWPGLAGQGQRALGSPLRAEGREGAVLQALGPGAQRLHALRVRLRRQHGPCWGQFGQGAILGRGQGGHSEDVAPDHRAAQGGRGTQGQQGRGVGWESPRAEFRAPRGTLWLLPSPGALRAWWPGLPQGHLGPPLVIAQTPTLTL